MRMKLVKELPGTGDAGGRNLNEKGFEYASQIFGQFLVLEEDEGKFKDWFQQCGIGSRFAGVFIQPCRSGAYSIS